MNPSTPSNEEISTMLKRCAVIPFFFLAVLQLTSCWLKQAGPSVTVHGFTPVKAELNLGDTSKFEFTVTFATSDGDRRLLVGYSKLDRHNNEYLGSFFSISTDEGASFGPERDSPGGIHFVEGGLAAAKTATSAGGGTNIFYTRSYNDGETWTEPVQINDEQGSVQFGFGGGLSFVQPSQADVYFLWTDRRRGFLSLFSSASHDGGRTWVPNQVVEYDFREGEQTAPLLLTGARGRLIAIWIDWRSRQTLADIRSAYSDDGGQHWSASQKINDDSEHVWQIAPVAVVRGNRVCVAFQDFREPGEEGDNDWNIYFARSDDNGKTWTKNVRVNDVQEGQDSSAGLLVDEAGTLYCTWRTCRRSLLGHVAFSYSTDQGQSWSRSTLVDESAEMLFREPVLPPVALGDKLLCSWHETSFDSVKSRFAWLKPSLGPTPIESGAGRPPIEEREAPGDVRGNVLFADDFSSESSRRWQPTSGVWMVVDGVYMGVEPASQGGFSSFADFKEPQSYILRGKFKLDPVNHYRANIYFRSDPARGTYYAITNEFRAGVWLSIKDNAKPRTFLVGRALAERRFPFQNNRWYQFTLIVAPERVDYFVDGRLMVRSTSPLRLPAGAIGVGGGGPAPSYFDDLVVSEPKSEASGERMR